MGNKSGWKQEDKLGGGCYGADQKGRRAESHKVRSAGLRAWSPPKLHWEYWEGFQQSQDQGAKFKGMSKNSVVKIHNISMQYFLKYKGIQTFMMYEILKIHIKTETVTRHFPFWPQSPKWLGTALTGGWPRGYKIVVLKKSYWIKNWFEVEVGGLPLSATGMLGLLNCSWDPFSVGIKNSSWDCVIREGKENFSSTLRPPNSLSSQNAL